MPSYKACSFVRDSVLASEDIPRELQRIKIDPSDSAHLAGKMDLLAQTKARIGDYHLELEATRDQMASRISLLEKELAVLRGSVQNQLLEIRQLSHRMMEAYDVDPSQEGWALNIFEGAFIRTDVSGIDGS